MATSNETLVRVDDFSKIKAIYLPASNSVLAEDSFNDIELSIMFSISFLGKSLKFKKFLFMCSVKKGWELYRLSKINAINDMLRAFLKLANIL